MIFIRMRILHPDRCRFHGRPIYVKLHIRIFYVLGHFDFGTFSPHNNLAMLSSVIRSAVRAPATASIIRRSFTTKYTEAHEYMTIKGSEATVGITDFAQNALGDVVYVDLPKVGDKFSKGEAFGSVESVKAASDVYAPASGEVIEINEKLADEPNLVNEGAMTSGWFIKMKLSDVKETSDLLDEKAYQEHCDKNDH
jgi:glycine cleavage system H protein